MSENEKSSKFFNFLFTCFTIFLLSIIGGIAINYILTETIDIAESSSFIVIVFLVSFMFYITNYSSKNKNGKLKGKDKMENQHFASLKELDKKSIYRL